MKLKIYFSMLSLACVSVLGYAQNFEDLEIISDYEMSLIGADISMDEEGMKFKNVLIPTYNRAGESISMSEFSEALMNMTAGINFYRNKGEKDIVAVRLRDMNAMELQMKKQQEEMLKNSPIGEGKTIPDFTLEDMEGNSYSTTSLAGKTVVFNTWFIKCKPCVMEMPELNELVHKYKKNTDIVFLGVTFDKTSDVESFLQEHAFDYNIITDQMEYLGSLQISGYPTNFVVDGSGKVLFTSIGYSSQTIKAIDDILGAL